MFLWIKHEQPCEIYLFSYSFPYLADMNGVTLHELQNLCQVCLYILELTLCMPYTLCVKICTGYNYRVIHSTTHFVCCVWVTHNGLYCTCMLIFVCRLFQVSSKSYFCLDKIKWKYFVFMYANLQITNKFLINLNSKSNNSNYHYYSNYYCY